MSGRFLLFLISAIVEINERIYVGGVYTRITYGGRIFEEAYFRDVNWVTYLGGISGWYGGRGLYTGGGILKGFCGIQI